MGQKNAKSKISSTSQESNSIDETEEKLDISFENNKLELENKENIKTSICEDDKHFYRISSNISERSEILSSVCTDDEKESVISDIELKESTSQFFSIYVENSNQNSNTITHRNSILIKDQTSDNIGEENELYLENRKNDKKAKKVIFADQVLFIRGDERIQIPLTRIASANDSPIKVAGFSKLLTNKIEEKTANNSKNKTKKFKFHNQSSRKNSLTNSFQTNIDTNQLGTWSLIKENTFYGLEKETAIKT
jgi:hypothetical protein